MIIKVVGLECIHQFDANGEILFQGQSEKISLTFSAAKRKMASIYGAVGETFYCRCPFLGNAVVMDEKCSARYELGSYFKVQKIEFEHVLTASLIKKKLLAKQMRRIALSKCLKKNRKCLKQSSSLFKFLEGDLHNIRPVIGQINRIRGAKKMAEISHMEGPGCRFKVRGQVFEPSSEVKGDTARIHLYMNEKYRQLELLDESSVFRFLKWHVHDPVDATEIFVNAKVAELQGDSNFWLSRKTKKPF